MSQQSHEDQKDRAELAELRSALAKLRSALGKLNAHADELSHRLEARCTTAAAAPVDEASRLRRMLAEKTILVTGGTGYLGRSLVRALLPYEAHSARHRGP